MCRPASMIVLRDGLRGSKYSDSHCEIMQEFGIYCDTVRGPSCVAVEITPPENTFNLPPQEWVFRTDQDILPDWYDAREAEARVRLELPAWIASQVRGPAFCGDIRRNEYVSVVCGASIGSCCGSVNTMASGNIERLGEFGSIRAMSGGVVEACCGRVSALLGDARIGALYGTVDRVLGSFARIGTVTSTGIVVLLQTGHIGTCSGICTVDGDLLSEMTLREYAVVRVYGGSAGKVRMNHDSAALIGQRCGTFTQVVSDFYPCIVDLETLKVEECKE